MIRTLIEADMRRIVKREEQILERLREPKALRLIIHIRSPIIDVRQASITRSLTEIRLESFNGVRGAVEVLRVARRAPRVEVALEHLRALDVVRRRDVEPVAVVELYLRARGRRVAGVVAVLRDVVEDLGADTGAIGRGSKNGGRVSEWASRSAGRCRTAYAVEA